MLTVLFLQKDLPEQDQIRIEEKVRTSPLVKDVRRVNSSQALERFRQKFPQLEDVIENLPLNPFPPSIEVTLNQDSLSSEEAAAFIASLENSPGVDDVQFNRDWVEKMESLSRLVRAIGFFLGGILVLASFFIISNVIKLNVFARRGEIEILRLVGATNTFIRIPFLVEGIILGIKGGLASLALLFLLTKLFPLYLGQSLGVLNELINFRYLTLSQSTGLVTAGAVTGFLGSLSSLARFLKI